MKFVSAKAIGLYLATVFLCTVNYVCAQGFSIETHSGDMLADSVYSTSDNGGKSENVLRKITDYFRRSNQEVEPGKFDMTFIGGPHYSDEKKFGVGLMAAGVYRPDIYTPASNVSLFGDVATVGFYEIGIMGNHITRSDASRLNYEALFYSMPGYYWGVGFDRGFDNSNRTKYEQLKAQVVAEWIWRVASHTYVGPSIEFSYISARKMADPEMWEDYAPTTFSYGVGVTGSYDTRDNITAPQKGMYAGLTLKAYPGLLFNKYAFGNIEATYSCYAWVWKGGVFATRVHGVFSLGRYVPWGMLATFGGMENMRGYYEGRYRDRDEMDLTIELRQHVWRRNGIAIWGGVGEVFRDFHTLCVKALLPSWGLGYRWEFKKNINIRIDMGFGRKSSNFIFSINEAF